MGPTARNATTSAQTSARSAAPRSPCMRAASWSAASSSTVAASGPAAPCSNAAMDPRERGQMQEVRARYTSTPVELHTIRCCVHATQGQRQF